MIVENIFFSKQFSYSMRLLLVFTEILIFTEIKARLLKVRKTVHSPTPTHTHPHPRKGHAHPHLTTPIIKKVTLTRTHLHLAKKATLTHNHPNPATKRSHSPTPSQKRSHLPTHNWKKECHMSNTWYIREKYSLFAILAGVFIFEKD